MLCHLCSKSSRTLRTCFFVSSQDEWAMERSILGVKLIKDANSPNKAVLAKIELARMLAIYYIHPAHRSVLCCGTHHPVI